MNTDPNTLTRREALLKTLKGAAAAVLALPMGTAASEPSCPPRAEFIPENDYPFFGYEPEAAVALEWRSPWNSVRDA